MPNTTITPNSDVAPTTAALHQPFSWLHNSLKHDANAELIALTRDVCQGVSLCLDLVHMSSADNETDVAPVLSSYDTARLMRFATASVRMLSERADLEIESMNRRAQRGGAA